MRAKAKPPKDDKPKVPGYIVTFSDMVTLLLTFFVLLLTLAEEQDPELFDVGRDSFFEAVNNCGLGMLTGRPQSTNFGQNQIKYRTNATDESSDERTIEGDEVIIQDLFDELSKSVETMRSEIVAETTQFTLTEIDFTAKQFELNSQSINFLNKFASNLSKSSSFEQQKIYILGIANDGKTDKENWQLSSKRAQETADYLEKKLDSSEKWKVYSWGAGPGKDWIGGDSPISEDSKILIALLKS